MAIRKIGVAAAVAMALAAPALHATTISTGLIEMGLFDSGGLGAGGVGLGLLSLPAGDRDAITPGCLCEGWGLAADGSGRYVYGGSTTGFTSSTLSDVMPGSAKSTVVINNGMIVTHTYSPAAGGKLFKIDVSILNPLGGMTVTDVRYARTLDWDVPPGHFSDDRTTIFVPGGAPAGKVLHTSFDPFAPPDPMVTRGSIAGSPPANTNGTDEPGDLGAYFILSFGDLDPGMTVDFITYIGADDTTGGLLGAFGAVGIEAYSYSFDTGPSAGGGPTFGWGFAGIGLPPITGTVPLPGTLALLGLGLFGLGCSIRRRVATV